MLSRLRLAFVLLIVGPIMSGCVAVAAVDAAATVGGAAIDVTASTIGAAGEVVEGTVDVLTPGDDDDDGEDERDRE